MDIVKASMIHPSYMLKACYVHGRETGFGFVFATPSRFEVGWNHGNPSSFQVPFKELSTIVSYCGVHSFGTYITIAKYIQIVLKT
jgi:hypothetical protein